MMDKKWHDKTHTAPAPSYADEWVPERSPRRRSREGSGDRDGGDGVDGHRDGDGV